MSGDLTDSAAASTAAGAPRGGIETDHSTPESPGMTMSMRAETDVSETPGGITEAIVRTVADALYCDVMGLPPLFDVVDGEILEALDGLTERNEGIEYEISFEYCGCDVAVSSERTVTVTR